MKNLLRKFGVPTKWWWYLTNRLDFTKMKSGGESCWSHRTCSGRGGRGRTSSRSSSQ